MDNFDSAEIPVGENKAISQVGLSTAAQALIGMNHELLKLHSSEVIFREAFARIKRKLRGYF
jgi:hypothetical protein